jgi:hypothetical protein
MNLETLLTLLAVVLAALFNVIFPWVRKRLADQQAGSADPEPQDAQAALAGMPTATPTPQPEPYRSAPSSAAAPMATAPPAPPAAARRRRRSALGNLSGMRDGIVLAAVLGPCRAQTPFV